MIISNIIGGLGNQMFQYACGRAVSLRTGCPLRVATDQFEGYTLHNGYELQRIFNINVPLASDEELKQLLGIKRHPALRQLLGKPVMHWATGRKWCSEPTFEYWPDIINIEPPVYLHGYWQSECYFKDFEAQIREDLQFRNDWDEADILIYEKMKAQPSASLHVRRGDYVLSKNQTVYALCNLDYYRNAIRILRELVPGIKLFAFSDDPDWVDSQLGAEFGPIDVVRHNIGRRSSNDMRLMSHADHHIIANSSFSWWGAWLNPSPNKIVIAPSRWFVNGIEERDLIPPNWIRV